MPSKCPNSENASEDRKEPRDALQNSFERQPGDKITTTSDETPAQPSCCTDHEHCCKCTYLSGISSSSELSVEEGIPQPGETISEVVRQIRRSEVEEYAKSEDTQMLDNVQKRRLHMVLIHVDRLEPSLCPTLWDLVFINLRALFRALTSHTVVDRDRPGTSAWIAWFITMIQACLGFKDDMRIHRRCLFLDWYILYHRDKVGIPSGELPVPMGLLPSEARENHYLFKFPRLKFDCWTDARVVEMVEGIGEHHAQAFKCIYGVEARNITRAMKIAGMRHVLDLRGFLHIYGERIETNQLHEIVARINWILAVVNSVYNESITPDVPLFQELQAKVSELSQYQTDGFKDYPVKRSLLALPGRLRKKSRDVEVSIVQKCKVAGVEK